MTSPCPRAFSAFGGTSPFTSATRCLLSAFGRYAHCASGNPPPSASLLSCLLRHSPLAFGEMSTAFGVTPIPTCSDIPRGPFTSHAIGSRAFGAVRPRTCGLHSPPANNNLPLEALLHPALAFMPPTAANSLVHPAFISLVGPTPSHSLARRPPCLRHYIHLPWLRPRPGHWPLSAVVDRTSPLSPSGVSPCQNITHKVGLYDDNVGQCIRQVAGRAMPFAITGCQPPLLVPSAMTRCRGLLIHSSP